MKKLTLILAAAALVLIGVASAGVDDQPRPGSPQVYVDIAAETDCASLQQSFDRAEMTHKRGGSWGPIGTAYMGAAHDRMRKIGCY